VAILLAAAEALNVLANDFLYESKGKAKRGSYSRLHGRLRRFASGRVPSSLIGGRP
jgi:hypothetical protein